MMSETPSLAPDEMQEFMLNIRYLLRYDKVAEALSLLEGVIDHDK